jgi:16S rRNA (guanine966-N2)-methyltransferase
VKVSGGKFRGRALLEPKDNRVRPTSDKVRQAIFNILAHNDFGTGFVFDGAKVIDIFAGTGALGIEALSRGARFCLFIDDNAESRALIRSNVEALNLTGMTKIWRRDGTELGPLVGGAGGPFDLAFLDAPYRQGLTQRALASLVQGGWLTKNALVIAEAAADESSPATPGLTCLDHRSYGETSVHTFGISPT